MFGFYISCMDFGLRLPQLVQKLMAPKGDFLKLLIFSISPSNAE